MATTEISWFKMSGSTEERLSRDHTVTFHGHILTLEWAQGDQDGGTYCCLVDGARSCVDLVTFDQGMGKGIR